MNSQAVAERIIAAHGGADAWRSREAVRVRFSSGGVAFRWKHQPAALSQVVGTFGTAAQMADLRGAGNARWSYSASTSAEMRLDLAALRQGRRRLRWANEDAGAFAAQAMWTYLNLPLVLLDHDVNLELIEPGSDGRQRLRVHLPRRLATHCPEQVLHIDESGLICRHDYVARSIGRWASAAQFLTCYREFAGVMVATRRRVLPRIGRTAFAGPTLVWIDIHDLSLCPS